MDYPLGAVYRSTGTANGKGLNPYSNGLPSRGRKRYSYGKRHGVLIPILMDYPLGVLENTLLLKRSGTSLNPYSNGLPSRSIKNYKYEISKNSVLIPILMDYPLGVTKFSDDKKIWLCVLIPILMDYPLGAQMMLS